MLIVVPVQRLGDLGGCRQQRSAGPADKGTRVRDERRRQKAAPPMAHASGGLGDLLLPTRCREFGISPKTGYKILTRYNATGLEGLTDRSRRPYRHANQLPVQIETVIVRLKQDKPSWGAPKIRERLARLYPDVHTPAISTVHAVLDRHGLVKRRTRRRNKAAGTMLSRPAQPNELWCADYKGEFTRPRRKISAAGPSDGLQSLR